MTTPPTFPGVLFGAAYYAEYQQTTDLATDLDLMQQAGFTVIRVGESVWSTWEPRDGEFELDWLQPVLDGAHERGIAVILGTPTYAIPPWLQVKHPEIAAEEPTGSPVPWGARQEMDQGSPVYRRYAERVIRKMVERYAAHPAVIGYQVDNEPGEHLPHNEHVFEGFREWLQDRYRTVDALNEAWGLVYWSHRLSEWTDLWRPDGNTVPSYDLDWRRYQATLATDLITWQAAIVREYARDDQFVTTCISYAQRQIDDADLAAELDINAGNNYYLMQEGLTHGLEVGGSKSWWSTGVDTLYQWSDRAYATKQAPYLVTETNAQAVGASNDNYPPFRGQMKQAALAMVARGARAIEYWHWHSLHFGTETYWMGVLPHSQRPGRIYREVQALGETLRKVGPYVDGLEPDAEVLVVSSAESRWAFEFTPPLSLPDDGPDTKAYEYIFRATYRGLFEAGAQVRVRSDRQVLELEPAELARRHPVLVAPALYIADDALLAHLRAYAEAGGHLVLGTRTGYADRIARARQEVAPPRLADAAGVWYDEFSNLREPLAVSAPDGSPLRVGAGAAGIRWVDALQVEDAEVLAEFAPSELEAGAAVTSRRFASGRLTVIATVPNPELARAIGAWLVPDTAGRRWQAPPQVSVTTGTGARGSLTFVSNWSGEPAAVVAPADVLDPETGERYPAGAQIPLEARGAAVLVDADRSAE
ncbi:beta-galactosidase [Amnibacterium sp. CER49]|uniref:beta-galactosidase n=1 Tax=Amnibacterium sp. CER49 TaxID=3039161 RepID=UPI00244D5079|nr:beta-galactosidase [Amnibacterium sp. CER49]MDH2442590.1 beta-galactosidase [Amnibacterium sp. CER49]